MPANSKQNGFTLIEIMVVVFIIAIMAGLSFFAINQASDRRYSSQAEDFLVWLEQLSDLAMLEGTAYGVSPSEDGLQAAVFYNYAWYRVSRPEPFYFNENARLSFTESNQNGAKIINETGNNENTAFLPDIIMLPNGYIEPDADLSLAFENYSPVFIYRLEDDGISLVIERSL